MIFASEKITIVYLVGNQLRLSFFKKVKSGASLIGSYQLQFSESEVKDTRILEPNSFSKKLTSLLDEKRLDLGELIILLPEKSLFLKGFEVTPQLNIPQAKQEFISEIPYSPQDLALKTIVEDGSLQLIAVEKNAIANLRSVFAAEMANVQAILPWPRIVSLAFPQENPTFLISTLESELTIFFLINKTILFSETKAFKKDELEELVILVLGELRQLIQENQSANVVLLNIDNSALVKKLQEAGFEVKNIQFEGDLLQLTAHLWFSKKLECLEEDLTLETGHRPSARKLMPNIGRLILFSFGLLAILAIFVFIFKPFILPKFQKPTVGRPATQETATKSVTAQISPTPTPTPVTTTAQPADFTIEVLNGNGIVGDAARFKEVLQEAGFVVKNTANAKSSDFEVSEINAKPAVPKDVISTLDKLIVQSYTKTTIATLSAQAGVDIQIILGQKK